MAQQDEQLLAAMQADTHIQAYIKGLLDAYTKAAADTKFELKGAAYSKHDGDAKYALKTALAAIYTKTEADAKFEAKGAAYAKAAMDTKLGEHYKKTEVDAKFALKTAVAAIYTKTEVNTKLGEHYKKTEADAKFALKSAVNDLNRPTVVSPFTDAKPTEAELVTAAKKLPHYTNDVAFWGAEHDFYIKDDPQTKMLLVKYRGVATNTSDSTVGNFFYEKLTKAA